MVLLRRRAAGPGVGMDGMDVGSNGLGSAVQRFTMGVWWWMDGWVGSNGGGCHPRSKVLLGGDGSAVDYHKGIIVEQTPLTGLGAMPTSRSAVHQIRGHEGRSGRDL